MSNPETTDSFDEVALRLTDEGDLEVALGVGRVGADGLEVLHGADAGLAVQEVVHLDVQAGQRGAHAVVLVPAAKLPPVRCAGMPGRSGHCGEAPLSMLEAAQIRAGRPHKCAACGHCQQRCCQCHSRSLVDLANADTSSFQRAAAPLSAPMAVRREN